LDLVVVSFDTDRMTLRVPTNKLEKSGMRKISSRKLMNNAITRANRETW